MAHTNRATPLLMAMSALALMGARGGCGGEDLAPPVKDPCEGLSEKACVDKDACEPLYVYADCGCPRGGDWLCDCAPEGPYYDGCQLRPEPPKCPPVCEIYCPYGNVLDADGCATCSCNPPPDGCEGLDEWACQETPGCRPIYVSWGGGGCECPDCPPGADCEACACQRPEPGGTEYAGCETVSRCEDLDEQTCISTPGCTPDYDYLPCPMAPCRDGFDCDRCDVKGFSGCRDVVEGCQSDADCRADEQCAFAGIWDCRCEDPANCGDCAQPAGGVCIPRDPGCQTDSDCGPGERCDFSAGEECFCPACYGPGCPPCDCRGNGVCVDDSGCRSDEDCYGGYCEQLATCEAIGCPPPKSYCVYPVCDDGSEAVCDMVPPECKPGWVSAIRNGCFQCVDARTCDVACEQVITYAADPETGTCYAFPTPCDVPEGYGPCKD